MCSYRRLNRSSSIPAVLLPLPEPGVACYDKLSQYYAISFLSMETNNTISPASMKGWLAKAINQEDIYCTLDERQIKSSIFDKHVTKESVL